MPGVVGAELGGEAPLPTQVVVLNIHTRCFCLESRGLTLGARRSGVSGRELALIF
jgi:hypothetical protein